MKMLVLMLWVFAVSLSYGAHEEPDFVGIDGEQRILVSYPLEVYLAERPDKRPEPDVHSSIRTRGYIAHFEVVEGSLRIRDLTVLKFTGPGTHRREDVSVIATIFPEPDDRKCDWFSGFLIMPDGYFSPARPVSRIAPYPRYRLLLIKSGELVSDSTLSDRDYHAFKERQFAVFKTSERYSACVAEYAGSSIEDWHRDLLIFHRDLRFPMEISVPIVGEKAAQPGATDNPDEAQRLREDH